MKVAVLGGYGHYGRYIARKLIEQEVVTTLITAGRSLEKAREQAESLGAKAEATRVDLFEAGEVPEAVRSADLIVNATGPAPDDRLFAAWQVPRRVRRHEAAPDAREDPGAGE